jgi:predicted ABC-type ATPase
MSHPSKVDFLSKAKKKGYKIYLYFICTRDPKINEQRVRNRVRLGGHQVSQERIVKRYYSSLSLLKEAFLIADRSFVIDSSTDKRNLILEKKSDRVIFHSSEIPGWVDKYLLDLIT